MLGVDIATPACEDCDERRAHQKCARTQLAQNSDGCRLLRGDSTAPLVVESVRAIFPAGVDLLHIDGDHSYDAVADDVRNYLPLVRPGRGVMILHDIGPHWDVHEFWRASRFPHAFAIQHTETSYGIGVVPC